MRNPYIFTETVNLFKVGYTTFDIITIRIDYFLHDSHLQHFVQLATSLDSVIIDFDSKFPSVRVLRHLF